MKIHGALLLIAGAVPASIPLYGQERFDFCDWSSRFCAATADAQSMRRRPTESWRRAMKGKMKQADRPDSVTTGCPVMTAIPLGRELLNASSFLPARSASNINACLFGIAPGGGYRVSPFVT